LRDSIGLFLRFCSSLMHKEYLACDVYAFYEKQRPKCNFSERDLAESRFQYKF